MSSSRRSFDRNKARCIVAVRSKRLRFLLEMGMEIGCCDTHVDGRLERSLSVHASEETYFTEAHVVFGRRGEH
jgi:hypothetical protein